MANADDILTRMRALTAAREQVIEPLAQILAQRGDLLAQLAALDEPYGKAYVAAEAAGWTPQELQELGADEPAKRPRVRRRSRGTASAAPASAPAAEDVSPAATLPAQAAAAGTEETAGSGVSS
ncbi:hypothetical protein [Streptomyces sp. NPDC006640]|uniref:hypothetical protein n=1 Tax=unclassified Streptomyces TaxID=2593676 RepID=UPI0036BC5654